MSSHPVAIRRPGAYFSKDPVNTGPDIYRVFRETGPRKPRIYFGGYNEQNGCLLENILDVVLDEVFVRRCLIEENKIRK